MNGANAASADSQRNPSALVQRVLSAVVLLPLVVVVCVWWGFWPFTALVVAAAVVGLGELYAAFNHGGRQANYALGIVLLALVLGAMIIRAVTGIDLLAPALALMVMISLAACASRHAQHGAVAEWALTFGGALYIGGLLGFLVLLRALETPLRGGLLALLQPQPGAAWIALVLMATWGQDVFAYFVGKRWGRRRMAPLLSPRKTWEGAAGGMFGALAGALLALALFGPPLSLWMTALIGVVAGIVGPVGDLSESFIKRQAGLKDAGSLIPGHGGILDRIDSVLFSAPAIYIVLMLVL